VAYKPPRHYLSFLREIFDNKNGISGRGHIPVFIFHRSRLSGRWSTRSRPAVGQFRIQKSRETIYPLSVLGTAWQKELPGVVYVLEGTEWGAPGALNDGVE
jgi:hypothetical protein